VLSDSLLIAGAKLTNAVAARYRRIAAPSAHQGGRARLEALQAEWESFGKVVAAAHHPTWHLSCGMGALEQEFAGGRLRQLPGVRQFGPLPSVLSGALSPDLASWLSSDASPVVYVSFGTMLSAPPAMLQQVIEGIHRAGYRALLVGASDDGRWPQDRVRVERWVSQPTVLRHPAVAAFVTHAGSGAIQEAGWGAKPVIAIPLLWDQPYNAWVAQELGFAVRLDKSALRAAQVTAALQQLTPLRTAAERVHDRFVSLDAEQQLRDYVRV
jgi:hypothetical protein